MWNPKSLLRRWRRAEQDFADEIASHIALEAERLEAEGWAPAGALAEARRRFGNRGAAQERYHDARVSQFVEGVMQDIRYSLRALRRSPVFTAVAVLSLALGIGANSAVFAFVDAALFRSLPVVDPDRLVMVSPDPGIFETIDYPTVARFRAYPQLFDGVAAVLPTDRANITIDAQPAGHAVVHLVTGDYFRLFGVRAAAGRTLTMDDERAIGQHPVVVISDSYWRSAFAHTSDVVGRALVLNDVTYTVVGVVPPQFTGDEPGLPADLWISVMMQPSVMPELPSGALLSPRRYFRMLARLKPHATLEDARRNVVAVYRQMSADVRDNRPARTAAELAAIEVKLTSQARGQTSAVDDKGEQMMIVWALVVLVLAIACVNVAGLLLVRAAARERELSTRLALGASVSRIARLLLTEGAVIAGVATALGVGLARLGSVWLERVAATGIQPIRLDLAVDGRVLVVTASASVMTIVMCGLIPARRAARLSVVSGLKITRGSAASSRSLLGRTLIVAQVALAVTLVVAAGLFSRTLSQLENQDTGFDDDRLLEAATMPDQATISGERLVNLYDAGIERIGAIPGVTAVAASSRGLLAGTGGAAVNTTVHGYVRPDDEQPFISYDYVTPGYFRTAGVSLLRGRVFNVDDVAGHLPVVIVSASMAMHYFGAMEAIGKQLHFSSEPGKPVEIVGVVRDVKDRSLREANVIMMYLPYRQDIRRVRSMSLIVRTDGDPATLAAPVRRVLRGIEPSLPLVSVEPMRNQMRHTVTMEWFTALASTFFGVVALFLAGLGLFAIVTQAVVARTSEIGIRMALGATGANVTRLVLAECFVLVVAGLLAGNGLARLASHAIAAQLFGVAPGDTRTFVTATAVVIGAALVAALPPVRRAARIDPAISLRHE